MSGEKDSKSSKDDEEVVLRDLQSLIRHTSPQVTVVDYVTSSLLPKGENYCSTMLKVEANVKKSKNAPVERLSLVAKMVPNSEFLKTHFNASASFAKEIYVFEKLLPIFRRLEKEAGLKDEELIDILPKFYGGRLTLDGKNENRADDDAVLLMENVKTQGYTTMNRKLGLDLIHAKMAIVELARFHGLSIALRHKDPEMFEEAKKVINIFPFDLENNDFDDIGAHFCEEICKDERVARYKDRIKRTLDANNDWKNIIQREPTEPWICFNHGDFWVNNIMFRTDPSCKEDDKPTRLKFVDFQMMKCTSPLVDLPYFLCGSTSPEVLENHFDELLDDYYEKLVETLKKHDCDVSPYTKTSFVNQLRCDAKNELSHCMMALKFFTMDVNEETDLSDVKSTVIMGGSTKLYLDRVWNVICKFVENDWLHH